MATVLSGSAPLVHRLPAPVAVLLGVVVLVAVILPQLWALVRHIGLMAHEGAHAFLGSGLGLKVESVRLERDGTGETALLGAAGSGAAVMFIGYLGPSGFGLIAAALIAHALIVPVLWIAVVLLLCLLFVVRGLFGIVTVIGTCVVLFLVARYAPGFLKAVTAYSLSWALLLGGLRTVIDHGTNAGDAHALRRVTHLPRALWSILWTAITLLALCFGCVLLA
ncbi:MAG: M50 family metallopeptidase [Streptosporangiaceae bacterium]